MKTKRPHKKNATHYPKFSHDEDDTTCILCNNDRVWENNTGNYRRYKWSLDLDEIDCYRCLSLLADRAEKLTNKIYASVKEIYPTH